MGLKRLIPVAALAAAGLGTARLRYVAIQRAVDPGTGIPHSEAWLNISFGVMGAFLALLLVVTLLTGRHQAPSESVRKNTLCKTINVVAGLLFVLAAGASFFSLSQEGASLINLAGALLALLCGVLVVLGAKEQENWNMAGLCRLAPVFYAAFVLLIFYRKNNANPLIYSFAAELFAFIAVLFACYGAAAFHFGKKRPKLLRFSSMASIYLLVTVLCSDNLLPFFTKGHMHFSPADLITMGAFLALSIGFYITLGPATGEKYLSKPADKGM